MGLERTSCCGIREYSGIQGERNAQKMVLEIADELTHEIPGAIVTFSNTVKRGSTAGIGYKMQEYIHEHNLRKVVVTEQVKNPNSGHYIAMWAWTVNTPELQKWYKKLENKYSAYGD